MLVETAIGSWVTAVVGGEQDVSGLMLSRLEMVLELGLVMDDGRNVK